MRFTKSARIVAVALTCILAVCNSHAQSADKKAKVEEYFRLIHLEATMDQMMNQMQAQMQKAATQFAPDSAKKMTPAQRKTVDDFITRVTTIIRSEMSWPKMEPQYVELYSSTLTDAELDGAIAFYKTPSGASLIAKQPELIAKSQEMSQQRMADIQPKLMEALQDFIKQAAASAPARP